MYYAIEDLQLHKLLATGCNKTDKRKTLEDYLYYRKEDLGEWCELGEYMKENLPNLYQVIATLSDEELDSRIDELFDAFVKEVPDEYILNDIEACGFKLIQNNNPFDCE